MDDPELEDPHGLGFPAGFKGWPHVYSLLNKYLTTNEPWTKEVSTSWEPCQSMLVSIIAVKYFSEERKPEDCVVKRCVKDDCHECVPQIVKGPPPKPRWPARHGHTQCHVDEELARRSTPAATLLRAADSRNFVRDVGLDFHDDQKFEKWFTVRNNKPPVWGTMDDMFGPGRFLPTQTPTATDESSTESIDDIADLDDFSPEDWHVSPPDSVPYGSRIDCPFAPDNTAGSGPLTSTGSRLDITDGLTLAAQHLELLQERDPVPDNTDDDLPPLGGGDSGPADGIPAASVGASGGAAVADSEEIIIVPPPPPAFLFGFGIKPVSQILNNSVCLTRHSL